MPGGPLATAAFESGMSALEELRLLKAQVQDVARVCMVSILPFLLVRLLRGKLMDWCYRLSRLETSRKKSLSQSRESLWFS